MLANPQNLVVLSGPEQYMLYIMYSLDGGTIATGQNDFKSKQHMLQIPERHLLFTFLQFTIQKKQVSNGGISGPL